MKKFITTLMMLMVLAGMVPFFAESADAQTTRRYSSRRSHRVYKKPNFYRRHRKAINIGAGTGAGMLVGGLLGGKKGVVIGGLAGAGTGAIVTHKQKPKNHRRYYRRY